MILVSFLCFLAAFAAVGLLSFTRRKNNQNDYYLASQSVPPWLVGLSAVATNNSGYMFIGVIGYTYTTGLASVWLMFGWILGDLLGSLFVHKELRKAAERTGQSSFAGVLSQWQGGKMTTFRRLSGMLALVFLLAYASAQLVAGSKALMVLLDWPQYAGALVGAVIIVLYCLAGGIRASIWTDAAQSFVMVVAMGLLLLSALSTLGGLQGAYQALAQVPGYLDWAPEDLLLPGGAGLLLFIVGWLFAGLSVIGQPHVMVRFMTLDDAGRMRTARIWYYSWFTIFYVMATAVGMLARVLLPDVGSFDAELALPTLALELLPAVLVGLILAGIFAATMSTADSLVLSCSSIVTTDLLRGKNQVWVAKLATVAVTACALAWALVNRQSVFSLVVMAWSLLASAFAPLLILLALRVRLDERMALALSATGVVVAMLWRAVGWHNYIYEGMPAILLALGLFGVLRWLGTAGGTESTAAESEPGSASAK